MICGRQIAAARALLGLSREELAQTAKLSVSGLEAMERTDFETAIDGSSLFAVKQALERAGISFVDERATSAAGGVGVRLAVPSTTSLDADTQQTVQYPEMASSGPFGAGG